MKNKLKQLLPKPQAVYNNRWLRWMGPLLQHPRLWHFSRKGVALGLALGIFFGLLIPVAQIPAAATMAVLLRANLPTAMASTLVTNPVTFGPVYYGAYKLGGLILGTSTSPQPSAAGSPSQPMAADTGWREQLGTTLHYLGTVGRPLVVGLAILATVGGLAVYFLTSALWVLKTRLARRRRLRERKARDSA